MLKPVVCALALLGAAPALALTCPRPDVGESYERADQRPETFVVALGGLQRTGPDVPSRPDTGNPHQRVSYDFPAHFTGRLANADGFLIDRDFAVTVEVLCASAWCGPESTSAYALYFLRRDPDGTYALESNPCGVFFFENPVEHQLMEVLGRMR